MGRAVEAGEDERCPRGDVEPERGVGLRHWGIEAGADAFDECAETDGACAAVGEGVCAVEAGDAAYAEGDVLAGGYLYGGVGGVQREGGEAAFCDEAAEFGVGYGGFAPVGECVRCAVGVVEFYGFAALYGECLGGVGGDGGTEAGGDTAQEVAVVYVYGAVRRGGGVGGDGGAEGLAIGGGEGYVG